MNITPILTIAVLLGVSTTTTALAQPLIPGITVSRVHGDAAILNIVVNCNNGQQIRKTLLGGTIITGPISINCGSGGGGTQGPPGPKGDTGPPGPPATVCVITADSNPCGVIINNNSTPFVNDNPSPHPPPFMKAPN